MPMVLAASASSGPDTGCHAGRAWRLRSGNAAQAEASPEIVSRIAPDAARPAASNPLIDAAKQLAAQSTAFKKEI